MITAEALGRRFGDRVAIEDVTFRVAPGEVVGLVGPNGAGKTTTLRLLLGVLRPTSGHVAVAGPVAHLPERYAPEPQWSVRRHLAFLARARGAPQADIDRVAIRTGVAGVLDRPAGRLSRGQAQRVGLAQALLGTPASVLLDEPTAGLDPRQAARTRALVRELADDGVAVLVATHVLAEAATCDRVVVLSAGRVVADEVPGDPADLERRFLDLVTDEASPDADWGET